MPQDLAVLSFDEDKGHILSEQLYGGQRLAQKFIIELLTAKGSMEYLPNCGCSFLPKLKNNVRTEFDILSAFSTVKKQLYRNMTADETRETPGTERYVDATISNITLVDESVIIEFIVRSRTGSSIRVATPTIGLK